MILDTFPTTEEFYATYWGKKPFIVRGHVPVETIESLIDADSLAGLALEEDIKSRIIANNANGNEWSCEHGPFDDDRFDEIGDKNWSLLVQNVEQYHLETATLFSHFQSSPRWLIDDIMVSFSATGGSVGPHTDSYHTFLVQGIGKRSWKISNTPITDDHYTDNPDMKVLANGFEGESYEVTAGDVIYMPPFFGHEGKTLEAAMTFSVGFLGPKTSEILGEYAQFLDGNETLNTRYFGEGLDTQSAGSKLSDNAQETIRNKTIDALSGDDFTTWLTAYFSVPTHEEIEDEEEVLNDIQKDTIFYKPEYIKMVITAAKDSGYNLGILGEVIHAPKNCAEIINKLNDGQEIMINSETQNLIKTLYQKNALSIKEK